MFVLVKLIKYKKILLKFYYRDIVVKLLIMYSIIIAILMYVNDIFITVRITSDSDIYNTEHTTYNRLTDIYYTEH